MTTNFFHPSLLLLFLDPGSEIWDLRSGMDKIRIRDPGLTFRIHNIGWHVYFEKIRVLKASSWFLEIDIMINRDSRGHLYANTEVKFLDCLKTNNCESICQ